MEEKYSKESSMQVLFEQTKIEEIMNTDVVKIRDNENLSRVEELFIENYIFYLMVIDVSDRLVGLISQKYLYKTHSPKKIINPDVEYEKDVLVDGDTFYKKETLDSYILENVMKKDPFVLRRDNTVAQVVLEMARQNLGCIPIVSRQNEVYGVVTHQEIINFSARILK